MTTLMIIISLISILFLCFNILNLLISLEMMILSLFIMMMLFYYNESFSELMIFLVMSVSESILGLTLMLIKVKFSGSDSFLMKTLKF